MNNIDTKEFSKLTSSSNDLINNDIIDYARKYLFSKLKEKYLNNDNEIYIYNKINNIKIELLSSEEYKKQYALLGGRSISSGAFCYRGDVYIPNYSHFDQNDFHKLIHEMLHSISSVYINEEGFKVGLNVGNKNENYQYGNGFNEAFTEYLTSDILEDDYTGYTTDFNYIIQLFMILSNINKKQLFNMYISNEEWLTDDVINSFNSSNDELTKLVVEYDNKLNQGKTIDYDNVICYLINSIKNSIRNNRGIDSNKISELLSQYINYIYDKDLSIKSETKAKLSEMMDMLGMYQTNHNDSVSNKYGL